MRSYRFHLCCSWPRKRTRAKRAQFNQVYGGAYTCKVVGRRPIAWRVVRRRPWSDGDVARERHSCVSRCSTVARVRNACERSLIARTYLPKLKKKFCVAKVVEPIARIRTTTVTTYPSNRTLAPRSINCAAHSVKQQTTEPAESSFSPAKERREEVPGRYTPGFHENRRPSLRT